MAQDIKELHDIIAELGSFLKHIQNLDVLKEMAEAKSTFGWVLVPHVLVHVSQVQGRNMSHARDSFHPAACDWN